MCFYYRILYVFFNKHGLKRQEKGAKRHIMTTWLPCMEEKQLYGLDCIFWQLSEIEQQRFFRIAAVFGELDF